MDNNRYYEIDVYPFSKSTAICELELISQDEKINLPSYIQLIKEVTDDIRFSNRALAEKIPEELLN